ncbi:UNVERIFIED_CONTAM: hypothetical protein O8I53_06560, partial [Campylobacter lari]
MEKKNVTLGLDLGVGSVGWAVVDNDTNEILKLGSRLFDEPKLATERRTNRGKRRLTRRKKYRNDKFYKLIIKYKNVFGFNNREEISNYFLELSNDNNNILELKV